MEYHSALKNNPSSYEKIFKNFKGLLISKRRQCEKATNGLIPTIWHSQKGNTREAVKRSVVARDSAGRQGAMDETRGAQSRFRYQCPPCYHEGGDMPLHLCQNPQMLQHNERTLIEILNLRKQHCITTDSPMMITAPPSEERLIIQKTVWGRVKDCSRAAQVWTVEIHLSVHFFPAYIPQYDVIYWDLNPQRWKQNPEGQL